MKRFPQMILVAWMACLAASQAAGAQGFQGRVLDGQGRGLPGAVVSARNRALNRTTTVYADEQGRTWGTPGAPARVPNLADGILQKAWFCGPPAHVIDGIKSIEAKYPGLEDFMIHWAEGLPPKEFKEQLRWFAREVMPAFQG